MDYSVFYREFKDEDEETMCRFIHDKAENEKLYYSFSSCNRCKIWYVGSVREEFKFHHILGYKYHKELRHPNVSYDCDKCNYHTKNKTDFTKHCNTKKHTNTLTIP